MKITVVGAGYVGLSLATLLLTKNDVIIYEINEAKVNMNNSKESPSRDDRIENDFKLFKETADVIIANMDNKDLFDVKNKIYTRDNFYKD